MIDLLEMRRLKEVEYVLVFYEFTTSVGDIDFYVFCSKENKVIVTFLVGE